MSKKLRNNYSEAQNIIYPSTKFKEINKVLFKDNEVSIKIIQEINRERRNQNLNKKEPEPFKLEKFKNIASKYLIPTSKSHNEPKNYLEANNRNSRSLNQNMNKPYPISHSPNKGLISKREVDESIYQIINKSNNSLDRNSVESPNNKEIVNNMKHHVKKKNYILENRLIINQMTKPLESNNHSPLHKNFGKTPDYIEKYKKEAEVSRKELNKQKEEATYPPGTTLISENERLDTLNNLLKTKDDLNRILETMPISNRSIHVENQRMSIIKKFEEIEENIRIFSRKKVFIRKEN